MNNILTKFKILVIILLIILIMTTVFAYADEPTIVSGAKRLASDVSVWLLALIPIAGAGAIGWQALMKILNNDPAVVAHANKMMKNILIAVVIGEAAAGIITSLLAYFQ